MQQTLKKQKHNACIYPQARIKLFNNGCYRLLQIRHLSDSLLLAICEHYKNKIKSKVTWLMASEQCFQLLKQFKCRHQSRALPLEHNHEKNAESSITLAAWKDSLGDAQDSSQWPFGQPAWCKFQCKANIPPILRSSRSGSFSQKCHLTHLKRYSTLIHYI